MAKSKKPRKSSAKKSAVPKAAKPRKVSERVLAARRQAEAFAGLPPNFPVIPFADTLVGREFYARVNCKTTPNRKGKLVQRCDTQRVTVVGGATPSADKPKRKQVFAVQKGQRFIVPDRELRRVVRKPATAAQIEQAARCENFQEHLNEGASLPASAFDECVNLAAPRMLPTEYAFDPRNPDPWDEPLDQRVEIAAQDDPENPDVTVMWASDTGVMIHPRRLRGGKTHAVIAAVKGLRQSGIGDFQWASMLYCWMRPGRESTIDIDRVASSLREAGLVVAVARASVGMRDKEPKANHHDGYHAAGDPFGVYLPPLGQWNPTAENLPRLGQAYIHNGKKLWFLAEVREWHHPQLGWSFFVFSQRGAGYCAEVVDRAHGSSSLVKFRGFSKPSEAYHALRQWYSTQSAPKQNRSTKGVPGGSYFSDRADAWIGQSVGGDDFAGKIRARALTGDGSPAHVVGGHVMTRSRAAAGARREDIRTGVLPAPVKRHKAPEVVATVRGERIESFPVRELPARVPVRGLPARVPVRMPTMQPPPMAAPRSQFGVPELEAARPRPSRFGVPGLEAARPRRVAPPAPPAVVAPRRASDQELMQAMMEELAAAGIKVKNNRRAVSYRR